MKILQILAYTAAITSFATIAHAQAISFNFDDNTVVGGTLVLLESGTDPTNDFSGDRFDEQTSADFQIQGITGIGTLGVTATALVDDLNILSTGLADGSSGYGAAGEGTSFIFDKDVVITAMDWASFSATPSSDVVELLNNNVSLGNYTADTVTGSTDFTSTNPATMNIAVTAGNAFTLRWVAGDFELQGIGLTVVPEPNTYALLAGISALGVVMLRRRMVK